MDNQKIELSVIIPAYNEDQTIPFLINDIKGNGDTFNGLEIIVVDNNSSDKTVEVTKNISKDFLLLKLVKAKKRGVACARNEGSKHAKGRILLFLDADSRISKDYIKQSVDEFKKRNLSVAVHLIEPITTKNADKFIWFFVNYFLVFPFQFFYPVCPGGGGIIVYRYLHEAIGGFDENMHIGEDHDYARRLSKKEKFRVLLNSKTMASMRRFEKEGRLKVWIKWIIGVPYYVFGRKMHKVPFKYEYGNDGGKNEYRIK